MTLDAQRVERRILLIRGLQADAERVFGFDVAICGVKGARRPPVVFDAIRELMAPPERPRRQIGFRKT